MMTVDENDEEVGQLIDWIARYGDTRENRLRICRLANNSAMAMRDACARLVEGLPAGDGFGGLNRNDIASRIRHINE